jgi:tetratricopeptide (TPR) repeat protein
MRILLVFILTIVFGGDISKIARVNKLKKGAEAAYTNGDYQQAISTFRTLTDSLGVHEDPVLLNLANAYFQINDTAQAKQYYAMVLGSEQNELRSVAHQQLGVIQQQKNKFEAALAQFKSALKANPSNEDARFNFELLKKMMENQQENQQDKNKDIEPSEYAKKLKDQADNLAKQNMFGQALRIMQMGLKEDETVAAYNEFITKLNDVVESQK